MTKATAIVPVKQLTTVKSRLSGRMPLDERRDLVLDLLRHSLSVLRQSGAIATIIVVTPDEAVAREARCHGVDVLAQEGDGINEAIRLGLDAAGERFCLVLLADLPLLTVEDIDALAGMAEARTLVLAPDRHGQGTNALVTATGAEFEPAFGNGSLAAHRRQAEQQGWTVREYRSPGTALDLDTPADLDEYARRRGAS